MMKRWVAHWFVLGAWMCVIGCQRDEVTVDGERLVWDEPPGDVFTGGGKSDAVAGLYDYPGRALGAGEQLSVSLEDGLAWATFEMARGQTLELSFEATSTVDALVYGPVAHRSAELPAPEEFLDAQHSRFVTGWHRPSREVLGATRGGHFLLIVRAEKFDEAPHLKVSTRCLRRCDSRQELNEKLHAVLPQEPSLVLPDRRDLASIPYDPANPLNEAKVELGRRLFHSPYLATRPRRAEGRQTYSCASCHNLHHGSGAGAPQGIGEGGQGGVFRQEGWSRREIDGRYAPGDIDAQPIASPTILNSAYLTSALWNGALGLGDVHVPGRGVLQSPNREHTQQWKQGTPPYWSKLGFSGLETQAIIGMHVHRQSVLGSALEQDEEIQQLFRQAFPMNEVVRLQKTEDCYHALQQVTFPETYFSAEQVEAEPSVARIECEETLAPSPYRDTSMSDLKASLALAAYERTLLATGAPFQQWLRDAEEGELSGSHAMTLDELYGARVFFDQEMGNCVRCHSGPSLSDGDFHVMGLSDLLESDRDRIHTKLFEGEEKGRGGWTGKDALLYAFKTPQLYNLSQKSFYGHGSTHRTLESMVRYMVRGEKMVGFIGGDRPLDEGFVKRPLGESEVLDLVSFVEGGLFDATMVNELPKAPTTQCLISADVLSRQEQGCRMD